MIPKISVVMPVHNGMPFLPEAVDSILSQGFGDFELIAIDDGSTDDTATYLRALDDSRVRYHRLERLGIVGALNHGLQVARSDLIARLDADDIAEPSRLERQYRAILGGDYLVVGCQATRIDEGGRALGPLDYPISDGAIRCRLAYMSPFLHPGVMARRGEILSVGGYRREYQWVEDYELWIRLALVPRGRLHNLPERLVRYRIHSSSVTSLKREVQDAFVCRITGEYVHTLCPEVEAIHFEKLNRMVRFHDVPDQSEAPALVRAFDATRRHFRREGTDPETEEMIRVWQRRLDATCIHFARQRRHDLGRVMFWLRVAGQFDPGRDRVGRMAEILPSPRAVVRRITRLLFRSRRPAEV